MDKDELAVWENSQGMVFIAWYERQDSLIYPDEPGNIESMANIIGVSKESVIAAVNKYQRDKRKRIGGSK